MSSLLERIDFLGVPLQCSTSVLTPRLETEMLVLGALERVSDFEVLIDIGTGSGAIALSIGLSQKKRSTPLKIYATDISSEALKIAHHNSLIAQISIDFREGDLLSPIMDDPACISQLCGQKILIMANLPYIPIGTVIPADVLENDPAIALWGWKDGTELIVRLIEQAKILSRTSQVCLACEVFEGHAFMLTREYQSKMDAIASWNDHCGVKRHILFTYSHATL